MSNIPKTDLTALSSQDDDRRIAKERVLIAEARVSIAAGDIVADDEVDAWLDHMVDSDQPMPIPNSGLRRQKVGA